LGIIRVDFDTYICFICQILEKKWEYNEAMLQLFIDLKKTYNLVRREVLYNILIEFGIPMKLVRLMKMCLNETYSRVCIGKHLSDIFPSKNDLKQEMLYYLYFSTLPYNVCHGEGSGKQDGLKLNGIH